MTKRGALVKRLTRRYDMRKKRNTGRGMSYGSNLRDKGYHVEFHQEGLTLIVKVYPRKRR